ncbi:gallerimycin-like [Battus philenor]|uniref:gallerimycin-like n=1 Tax=Battus philenor TaxID=42288 RepID=UPI0035CFA1CB
MKAHIILIAFFVGFTIVSALSPEDDQNPSPLLRLKRDTIFVKPPPGCIFYECIGNCRQRGHKSGGYCTINGCVCL